MTYLLAVVVPLADIHPAIQLGLGAVLFVAGVVIIWKVRRGKR